MPPNGKDFDFTLFFGENGLAGISGKKGFSYRNKRRESAKDLISL
jgi:hypothetical protein